MHIPQSLLRIPSLAAGRTEEQLCAQHLGEDGLVADPDFLPGVASLYPDPNQPPASAPTDIAWRRVSGSLYLPTGKAPRLLQVGSGYATHVSAQSDPVRGLLGRREGPVSCAQGGLNSGCFLGALAAVAAARGGELLLNLILSDEAAGSGAYTFQFFKHGTWQPVVVDNYLPCLPDQVGGLRW